MDESVRVLVEERRSKTSGLAVGMSDNYVRVLFDASQEDLKANQFAEVRVTSARENAAFGELLHP